MGEPSSRPLSLAALDEDDVTPETATALERAGASLVRGAGIPHEEILRGFGLR